MDTVLSPTSAPIDLLFHDHDAEMARSRTIIALVPDGQNDWRPNPKSMTLGRLATHLAELPSFGIAMCSTPEYDFATGAWTPATLETTAERLALVDKLGSGLKQELSRLDWPAMSATWVLRMGDTILMKDARARHLRLLYSHMTHHRAQLGVYLRLLGVAIPGTYGPSADEM